jgi:uncharacterized protein YegP (UPF0339 family)
MTHDVFEKWTGGYDPNYDAGNAQAILLSRGYRQEADAIGTLLRVYAGARAGLARLQPVVTELQEQRGRLEQLEAEYQPGLVERRLADDLLDTLQTYEAAAAAGGE